MYTALVLIIFIVWTYCTMDMLYLNNFKQNRSPPSRPHVKLNFHLAHL